MPAIRYRHNYRAVVLNGEPGRGGGISGDRVPVKMKDGSCRYFPFRGFAQWSDIKVNSIKVKIDQIEAFTQDDSGLTGMVELPTNTILGVYRDGVVLAVIKDGALICV